MMFIYWRRLGSTPSSNHGSHCFEHSKLGSHNIHLKYSRLNMNIKNYPIGYWTTWIICLFITTNLNRIKIKKNIFKK